MPKASQERAAPRRTGPASALQLLLIWAFVSAVLVFAHASLLRLPYYWDEAGYYIPAAYDFFRTGTLIPFSTLTNAHPPGLSLYLAAAWKLFGFAPLVTRVAMCLAAATALVAVYRIVLDALESHTAAAAVTLLTAAYPVWFTQSSLAHADTLAAAATLWGLRFACSGAASQRSVRSIRRSVWAAALCFTLAGLTKEIAIGTPLALASWELIGLLRRSVRSRPLVWPRIERAFALMTPVLPLATWFAYHRWRTGFMFGNPEYLRYNASATLSGTRILLALAHRVLHLTAHLNLFVPVAVALGSLLLPVLPMRGRLHRDLLLQLWVVIVANALLFSVLGGALLTRYLLPVYPLVLLLAFSAVYARFRHWAWFVVLGTAAFVGGLMLPPPYRVAPEDTLSYRDAIVLEQEAIAVVETSYPHSTVLSAWPVTDGLRKPELGYVHAPVAVVPIDNFSLPALQALVVAGPRGERQSYSTAIVFSTKYAPPGLSLSLGRWGEQQEERYFALHHDLDAQSVAQLLGGSVVWQQHRGGLWASVLRFDHPQLTRLAPLL
ncbi:glycosyltransferase family 39 protein [Acidipila sp. EB88]|uniref:glycosyltransferase family 39 protein n=1 Tax=Acidipila sp. EB88 TaxID=2305226 RepID=UPI001F3BE3A8|nr:glycosyltransferase family 39 protein [Acidipila sp. EB88]